MTQAWWGKITMEASRGFAFWLVVALIVLDCSKTHALNDSGFYSASLNTPGSLFSGPLVGATFLENIYNNYNATGLLALGTIFLAASGFIALKSLPPPEEVKYQVEEWKKDPLAFLPQIKKPNLKTVQRQDVTFNYDLHGYDPYDNGISSTAASTYPRHFHGSLAPDFQNSQYNFVANSPGPPYSSIPAISTVHSVPTEPVSSRRQQIVMKIKNADPSQESSLLARIKNALTKTVENFASSPNSFAESGVGGVDVDYGQSENIPVYDFFEPRPKVKRPPQQYIPYLKRNQNKIYEHANTQIIQLEKRRRQFAPTKASPPNHTPSKYSTKFPWKQYY